MLEIGIKPTEIVAAGGIPVARLGTRASYDDPVLGYQEFVYGKFNGGTFGIGSVCVESNGFVFAMITTANTAPGANGFGSRVGVAQGTGVDQGFGWFQVYGKAYLRVLPAVVRGTRLNTTATTGSLDDDGTAGARVIEGVTIQLASGANPNTDATLTYPSVGATL